MKKQCMSSSRRVERFSLVVFLFLALGTCLHLLNDTKIFKQIIFCLMGIGLVLAGGDQAIAGTLSVTENPAPVFSTLIPDQAYVIKDNVNYKLYYSGNDFGSINLAQSPDGLTWTPYAGNPVLSEGSSVQGEHADVLFIARALQEQTAAQTQAHLRCIIGCGIREQFPVLVVGDMLNRRMG